MSKKNKKKPSNINQRLNEIDMANTAAHRVNTVISKMIAPPETVMAHLQRIGVTPIIDEFSLDDKPGKVYMLIDFEDLQDKELHNIACGGELKDSYPPGLRTVRPPGIENPDKLMKLRDGLREAFSQAADNQVISNDGDEDYPLGESPAL